MNLRDYLYFERKTLQSLANEIGVSRSWLSKVANLKIKPTKILAGAIERATEGKVTIQELMGENEGKLK